MARWESEVATSTQPGQASFSYGCYQSERKLNIKYIKNHNWGEVEGLIELINKQVRKLKWSVAVGMYADHLLFFSLLSFYSDRQKGKAES